MTRLFALVLALSAGCSFALGGPDPERPKAKPPQCDTGKGLVVVDGLFATGLGIAALSLMGSNSSGEREAAIGPIIFAAVYAGAAFRGNSVVNDCRKAMDEYVASSEPLPTPPPVLKPRKRIVEREQPVVEPAVAKPEPAAVQPPPPAPPAPKPEPKAKAEPAPWSEFWKELP